MTPVDLFMTMIAVKHTLPFPIPAGVGPAELFGAKGRQSSICGQFGQFSFHLRTVLRSSQGGRRSSLPHQESPHRLEIVPRVRRYSRCWSGKILSSHLTVVRLSMWADAIVRWESTKPYVASTQKLLREPWFYEALYRACLFHSANHVMESFLHQSPRTGILTTTWRAVAATRPRPWTSLVAEPFLHPENTVEITSTRRVYKRIWGVQQCALQHYI